MKDLQTAAACYKRYASTQNNWNKNKFLDEGIKKMVIFNK